MTVLDADGFTTQSQVGLFPWQHDQWEGLIKRLRAGALPHALLLTGVRGLGKNHFARILAQSLLCNSPQPDGQACQVCRSCLLYKADTHPDFFRVYPKEEDSSAEKAKPKEKSKLIVVDQIRAMNNHLALKSQYAGHKLVIISPADQMNTAAANSLLKTLEEPAPHSLLMLITSQPARLPATVRSRCQQIKFIPPSEQAAARWLSAHLDQTQNPTQLLALAAGAPLTALAMATDNAIGRRAAMLNDLERLQQRQADPLSVAATWLQGNLTETLGWMLSCVMDMARLRNVAQPRYLANPDIQQRLRELGQHINLSRLYACMDTVTEVMKLLNRQVNTQLLLEDMLILWSDAAQAHRPASRQPSSKHNSI
ncbi:MAG: DNA polymerase III subunit delta' [Gammaproteobacteria bacterium]